MIDLKTLCEKVTQLTASVGEFILNERNRFSIADIEQKGHNDLVSYVDKEAERRIVEQLTRLFPEAGFLTEENTVSTRAERYNWIIDPLDGTTNYVHGLPCFCISIALMDREEEILGVVHELNLGECFYAWKDGGAYLNGEVIRVSEVQDLANSLLATGFPYHDYSRMKPYMEVFDYCMRNTHGLRRLGSAAADLAYVACGRFEAFYEYGLNAWDLAAGSLLVKEAGGSVGDFRGGKNYLYGKEIIAANRQVYPEFLQVLQNFFRTES